MTEVQIETLEQLVEYALQHAQYGEDYRWTLKMRTSDEYLDPEAGKAWDNEYYGAKTVWWNEPGYEGYEQRQAELRARRPAQQRVTYYWLEKTSSGYCSYSSIHISVELGEMLLKVWPTRKTTYDVHMGQLTLAGAIKRLGKTDIGKQVEAAKAAAEAAQAMRIRNNMRAHVRRKAAELLELVVDNPSIFTSLDLQVLATLEDEV